MRSKLLWGHLVNEQSGGVEGHCFSPGQIDAEAAAKSGLEVCPGLQNKWAAEPGAHPPTSLTQALE